MTETVINYYENYTPAGDILVLAVCLTFVVLIHASYINRSKGFTIFLQMLGLLVVAAASDIIFHMLMSRPGPIPLLPVYIMRVLYHAALFANLLCYVYYISEMMHLDNRERKKYVIIGSAALAVLVLYEILGIVFRFGTYINKDQTVHNGFSIFPIGYVFFVGLVLYMAIHFRERIYKQVMIGIVETVGISFILLLQQGRHGQTSFTTASFLLPMIALLYLVHSNPYDLEIGAVNAASFEDRIAYHHQHAHELLLMSLLLPEFESNGRKYPAILHRTIRFFVTYYFREAVMFQVSSGRMVLTMEIGKNPDYEETLKKILEKFREEHEKFRLDHKIVITKTVEQISEDNDYIGFIQYVEEHMSENTIHRVIRADVEHYLEHRYIIRQLADISEKADMWDNRIEVYCQPVLNLETGRYDTAETLMRLNLDGMQLVLPDHFIPLAEEHGFITTLSKIILTKTCQQVRLLLQEGYFVERVSVNFSMLDLRDPAFSSTVSRTVRESGIPSGKIAIELTESQNERDFMLVKSRISELRDSGVKFYLDDFGTGYSNFERIMELPFDIIKFDRSLVLASGADPEAEKMVTHLAHMFSDMGYAVLYEGVETESDEQRCAKMSARYLQGNRYSKPIPIEQLRKFFDLAPVEAGV